MFKVLSNPLYSSYLKGNDSLSVCSLNASPCQGIAAANPLFPAIFPKCKSPFSCRFQIPFFLLFSRLRPLDIEFMKRLSKVVNIVPVIAKADTLTLEERDYFKQRVRGCCPFPGLPSGLAHPLLPLVPLVALLAGLCRPGLARGPAHSSGCSSERSRVAAG